MHHAALEPVGPVVVAVVAVDDDGRLVEQALALERREEDADGVVGDLAGPADLVGVAGGVRRQGEAVLDVGDEIPDVDRERRRVGQLVEAREQRREVVGAPDRRQVAGPC